MSINLYQNTGVFKTFVTKMSSAKWPAYCLGLNGLNVSWNVTETYPVNYKYMIKPRYYEQRYHNPKIF